MKEGATLRVLLFSVSLVLLIAHSQQLLQPILEGQDELGANPVLEIGPMPLLEPAKRDSAETSVDEGDPFEGGGGHNNAQTGTTEKKRHRKVNGVCRLPLALGNCSREFTRFYYDPAREQCFKFIYTGCGGNANRFVSRHQCKRRCSQKYRRKHKKTRLSAKLSTQYVGREREKQLGCLANCTNGVCVRGKCQCKKGFELRGAHQCVDSNECHWTKCSHSAVCVNLPGSFRCECKSGFAGSGFNCSAERRICSQWFDSRYERQCQPEQEWTPRFYFHLHSGQCRQFWYGGCQFGESQNFFVDQKSCGSICGGYSHEEFFTHQFGQEEKAEEEEMEKLDTVSATSPCLDPFDESLREPCTEGIWKRRYYYDASGSRRCRVFWMDASCAKKGRQSDSRNIFVHASNCRRACEGRGGAQEEVDSNPRETWTEQAAVHQQQGFGVIQASFARNSTQTTSKTRVAPKSSAETDCDLESLSDALLHAHSSAEKRDRLSRLKARLREKEQQRQHHSHRHHDLPLHPNDACLDAFEWSLTRSCGLKPWRTRFFFDQRHGKCRPFWSDGCQGNTRNNFDSEQMCAKMCELPAEGHAVNNWNGGIGSGVELRARDEHVVSAGSVCEEPFDSNYRRACDSGRGWRRRWFYDRHSGLCRHFWYDGCTGASKNIFDGLKECMDTCVRDIEPKSSEQSHQRFAYFGSGEEQHTPPALGFWASQKNYLHSGDQMLGDGQCTAFRYNATGKASLSAFLCLMEEGGGCQRKLLWATEGDEKCSVERPWMKGRHNYTWFFTLERLPSWMKGAEGASEGRHGTASAVLTVRQLSLNITNSALVPIEPFGERRNETVAWVDLLGERDCERLKQMCDR